MCYKCTIHPVVVGFWWINALSLLPLVGVCFHRMTICNLHLSCLGMFEQSGMISIKPWPNLTSSQTVAKTMRYKHPCQIHRNQCACLDRAGENGSIHLNFKPLIMSINDFIMDIYTWHSDDHYDIIMPIINLILKFGQFHYSQRAQHYLFLFFVFVARASFVSWPKLPHFPWASRLSLLLSPGIHYINPFFSHSGCRTSVATLSF